MSEKVWKRNDGETVDEILTKTLRRGRVCTGKKKEPDEETRKNK